MIDYGLDEKVAIVTGAGSGFGRAVALSMGRAGARVIAADVSRPAGEETLELVREAGAEAAFVLTDVAIDADVKAMVQAALDTFGRLDMAFNNAGITIPSGPVAEADEADFDRLMGVNVKGVWLCMKHEIPALLQGGGGAIVNTSSTAGLTALPGGALYSATKHAVLGMTRGAALDYAQRGIRINAVNPSAADTPMVQRFIERTGRDPTAAIPMGRLATPGEVADAVLWLCSDRSSFVTGQPLVVDGGFTAQ